MIHIIGNKVGKIIYINKTSPGETGGKGRREKILEVTDRLGPGGVRGADYQLLAVCEHAIVAGGILRIYL